MQTISSSSDHSSTGIKRDAPFDTPISQPSHKKAKVFSCTVSIVPINIDTMTIKVGQPTTTPSSSSLTTRRASYKSDSPEHSPRSNSPEHSLCSNSPEHSLRSNSPEHSLRSNSPEHSLRSNSPEHSPRSIYPNAIFGRVERVLVLPDSIDEITHNIISLINSKRGQILHSDDLTTCLSSLAYGDNDLTTDTPEYNGTDILNFLTTITDPTNPFKKLINLQEQIAPTEATITRGQFEELLAYLKKEIFNSKKVAFSFDDMAQMFNTIRLKTEDQHPILQPFSTEGQAIVRQLVKSIISWRICQNNSIRIAPFTQEVIGNNEINPQILSLLHLFSAETLSFQAITQLYTMLYSQDDSPLDKAPVEAQKHIKQLQTFFDKNIFQKWLLRSKKRDCFRYLNELKQQKII